MLGEGMRGKQTGGGDDAMRVQGSLQCRRLHITLAHMLQMCTVRFTRPRSCCAGFNFSVTGNAATPVPMSRLTGNDDHGVDLLRHKLLCLPEQLACQHHHRRRAVAHLYSSCRYAAQCASEGGHGLCRTQHDTRNTHALWLACCSQDRLHAARQDASSSRLGSAAKTCS
jgi:hypothetical protein